MREASQRHFGIGQWTDFVRGAADEADSVSMTDHLESGCESCRRVVASLRAAYGADPVPSVQPSREVMELVWDSALAPFQLADAGPAESGRQLNFSTSEFELSARLEDGDLDAATALMARLQSKFKVPVTDLPVTLCAAGSEVDSVTTGELGEFELSLDVGGSVELVIALDDEHELVATVERSG